MDWTRSLASSARIYRPANPAHLEEGYGEVSADLVRPRQQIVWGRSDARTGLWERCIPLFSCCSSGKIAMRKPSGQASVYVSPARHSEANVGSGLWVANNEEAKLWLLR